MLAHDVFFSLNDTSPEAVDRLVRSCHSYLKDHPGLVFYAAGVLAKDCTRDVNDRNFDVALQMVFTDKEAHDTYQVSESHQQFIAENKSNWKQVRIFDAYVDH
ncbi:MAG: Dabb family protein [Planctomycetaceae bacterium]|nr:Dabb family protein [Planctomycetaceae bacterium]MCA9111620.1 Dabb family protein [Planctomycetaceae bacterium]